MKEIFYSERDKFDLTESEFSDAMKAWGQKKSYYCKRLKSNLSPYHKFTRPSWSNAVYLKLDNGKYKWFLKAENIYMYTVNGVLTRLVFKDDAQKKTFEDRIITADEFYDGWDKGYQQE